MELKDVKQFFEDNKDNDEVQTYLKELNTVSKEDVEGYLESEEGKKLLQPKLDQYFTKGLETWKEKNLDKLVNEKAEQIYQEKNPEETPEQKEIRELRQKIEQSEKKAKRQELKNKAISTLTEKELPTNTKLIDKLIGEDEESTFENISIYEETINGVKEQVKSNTKVKGRKHNDGDPPPAHKGPNPFSKEHFNLTEQGKIMSENPELAKQLKEQAKG